MYSRRARNSCQRFTIVGNRWRARTPESPDAALLPLDRTSLLPKENPYWKRTFSKFLMTCMSVPSLTVWISSLPLLLQVAAGQFSAVRFSRRRDCFRGRDSFRKLFFQFRCARYREPRETKPTQNYLWLIALTRKNNLWVNRPISPVGYRALCAMPSADIRCCRARDNRPYSDYRSDRRFDAIAHF